MPSLARIENQPGALLGDIFEPPLEAVREGIGIANVIAVMRVQVFCSEVILLGELFHCCGRHWFAPLKVGRSDSW